MGILTPYQKEVLDDLANEFPSVRVTHQPEEYGPRARFDCFKESPEEDAELPAVVKSVIVSPMSGEGSQEVFATGIIPEPCAVCGFNYVCGDIPGEDCHS